jgi:hypothetical protein
LSSFIEPDEVKPAPQGVKLQAELIGFQRVITEDHAAPPLAKRRHAQQRSREDVHAERWHTA